MQPHRRTARPLMSLTLPFSADEARVEIRPCRIGPSSGRQGAPEIERVKIEFYAVDAATWNSCQLAIGRAFPAGSGLRSDNRTGVFSLPISRWAALEAWLAWTFEAPVQHRESSSGVMPGMQRRQSLGESGRG